ncbi:MAG: hypothetical protein K9M97_07585 [Akkermansiaceae bacterium]|nr:hypothetical protein [Akkermansiaceae bacterium]
MPYLRILAVAALGATAALAQDLQSNLPGFDASRVAFSATGKMEMGIGNGEVDVTTLGLRSFLCQPITPAEGIYILTDHRLGLYASRRLINNVWLTVGAGITLGNELDYATASGTDLLNTDPDSAFFGVVSLRVKAW